MLGYINLYVKFFLQSQAFLSRMWYTNGTESLAEILHPSRVKFLMEWLLGSGIKNIASVRRRLTGPQHVQCQRSLCNEI